MITKKARKAQMKARKAAGNTSRYQLVNAHVLFPGMTAGKQHWGLQEKATGLIIPVTGNAQGFEPQELPINWMEDSYKGREYLKPEFIAHWEVTQIEKAFKITAEVEAVADRAMAIAKEYEVI